MLIDYENVKDLLELDIRDEELDRMMLNSVYKQTLNYLGHELELKNYKELVEVKDYITIVSNFPLITIDQITDMKTNATVDYFTVDYPERTIQFQPRTNDHVVFIEYTAGYTTDTLPADLKEAIIKLFVIRKNDFKNKENLTESKDNKLFGLPNDIKEIFDMYSKKRL